MPYQIPSISVDIYIKRVSDSDSLHNVLMHTMQNQIMFKTEFHKYEVVLNKSTYIYSFYIFLFQKELKNLKITNPWGWLLF